MERIATIVERQGRSSALKELVRLLARQAARDYHTARVEAVERSDPGGTE